MSNKYAMNYKAANSSASSRARFTIALAVALVVIASGFGCSGHGSATLFAQHA